MLGELRDHIYSCILNDKDHYIFRFSKFSLVITLCRSLSDLDMHGFLLGFVTKQMLAKSITQGVQMRVMLRRSPSRLKASPVGGVDRFEIRIFAKAICIVQLRVPVVINNMDNILSPLVTGPICSTMSQKGCKSFAATPLTPLELQYEGRG